MEGIENGSFFSCVNILRSAAYKAVARIGVLGQRIVQVADPKGAGPSVFSKVSSYIQSFFASNHSKVNPEVELTMTILKGRKVDIPSISSTAVLVSLDPLLRNEPESPKDEIKGIARKIIAGYAEIEMLTYTFNLRAVPLETVSIIDEPVTGRESFGSECVSEYGKGDPKWMPGRKIVNFKGEEIGYSILM